MKRILITIIVIILLLVVGAGGVLIAQDSPVRFGRVEGTEQAFIPFTGPTEQVDETQVTEPAQSTRDASSGGGTGPTGAPTTPAPATAAVTFTSTVRATNTPASTNTSRPTNTPETASTPSGGGGAGVTPSPAVNEATAAVRAYRDRLDRETESCQDSLEGFETFTAGVAENPAIVFNPASRPVLDNHLREIDETCGELGSDENVPPVYAEVDRLLDLTAEEFQQMTDKFARGVDTFNPALILEALEHQNNAAEYITQAQAALLP